MRRCKYDRKEAEELEQNTWVVLLEALRRDPEKFPNVRSRIAWAIAAMKNVQRDGFRKQRRRQWMERCLSLVSDEPMTSAEPYPDMTPKQLSAIFARLSPAQRDVLYLLNQGRSYRDIGRLLNLNASAVRKRIHDARAALKNLLE